MTTDQYFRYIDHSIQVQNLLNESWCFNIPMFLTVDPVVPSKRPHNTVHPPPNIEELQLISSVNLQVQLHPIANPIILQRQLILEWSLSLSLQHDLMWLSPNARRNLSFEQPNRIARKTWNRSLSPQPIIDMDDNHRFTTCNRCSSSRRRRPRWWLRGVRRSTLLRLRRAPKLISHRRPKLGSNTEFVFNRRPLGHWFTSSRRWRAVSVASLKALGLLGAVLVAALLFPFEAALLGSVERLAVAGLVSFAVAISVAGLFLPVWRAAASPRRRAPWCW